MADRTMEELLQAPSEGYEEAIVIPEILAENFEIKTNLLQGGLCLPCDLKEKTLYNYDPNAYSFDNSNYFPQTQYENYLCNLCENNSHDGYDSEQQFQFVYEQEPSYNQNYDDNYYPHESPSYPCCDYCGGSHETFQCQLDNKNVDFFGSDQIQTPQYPDVNPPPPEISNEEIFQAKGDLMKSIQTFLERFNCIPFEEKPQILFQTWETFFAIQCSQPEDSNELFQKLLKDIKELAEYNQSTRTDRPIFNDNENHPVQNKESPENSSEEIVVSKTNQEPPQDSNIHQLIKECSIEVPKQQKHKMEDTMLELVKICQKKSFFVFMMISTISLKVLLILNFF
nr:reverse transcriptase domain-containing protein [Tanacetum cinerariifolium]